MVCYVRFAATYPLRFLFCSLYSYIQYMGILHLHELPPHVPLDIVSMMLYSYIQYMGILHRHELPPHVPLDVV